ncbi:Uncharacterized protein AXF42_Ash019700 [Apostasia shenzhenica]|uniref:Uncharacterized protein n=1 Tax=Apostasia shenzhenica TaxID=1088818 RepID=A0A2H9ZTV2_9ASPA|nr:Uncharacterized protein AXF42_Ash019700 [Apostasia shenzhenica]
MTELAGWSRIPARSPDGISSIASEVTPDRKPRRHRRIRSPAFSGGSIGAGARFHGHRKSSPSTPFLRWKFDGADLPNGVPPAGPSGCKVGGKPASAGGKARQVVSARKLAAGIWSLRPPEFGERSQMKLDLEFDCGLLQLSSFSDARNEFGSFPAGKTKRNGISHKPEGCSSLLHSSIERATKWDPGCQMVSEEAFGLYDRLEIVEDKKDRNGSIVSALRSELQLARSRVSELETEQQSAKKKLDQFLKKIEEEKGAWRRREHEKIRSVIDAMKEDLNREKKNRQRLEILNTKVVNELAEAKLSAKKLLQEYEKERKARELVEEVCNELAKEIGDDKVEVETLKMESMKTREEIEEERKMLQMAEVWREERVQMKLVDAKLALEEKYSQLSILQDEIEAFLRSQSRDSHEMYEIKQAEALREAVESAKFHEIKEFTYMPPPASEGIFSIFEEIQQKEQVEEKESERVNGSSGKSTKKYDNLIFNGNGEAEGESGWETVSHVEEQDSCKSPEGSEPSVNGVYLESQASVSSTDWEDREDDEMQNSEISEICSITTKLSRKKVSSISRLWKSSRRSNAEDFNKMSFELTNGNLFNGRLSNAASSPARKSGEAGLSSPSVCNWSSADLLMKGCADLPRGMQKQSLKAKLMEARIQSKKIQLRQVLKQKI